MTHMLLVLFSLPEFRQGTILTQAGLLGRASDSKHTPAVETMDFDVGGLSGAQNKPMEVKMIDFDVCELAMDGTGLKTSPGQPRGTTLT